ncbi:MAG: hypothetical protein QOD03_1246 [Verrucomicrobiota bacterium]
MVFQSVYAIMTRIFHNIFWQRLIPAALALLPLVSLNAQTNTNSLPLSGSIPRRPSIILILADNIGYGDLGCYGQTKIKTPNLDKLASEGIRFTHFYAASPDDASARAALFTGVEPRNARADLPLGTNAVALAAWLKQLGYHTGLVGEWGLGYVGPLMPNQKGFDEFAGFLNDVHARDYFSDKIYRQDPKTGFDGLESLIENSGGQHGRYLPGFLGAIANNFLKINLPEKFNGYRPFFLCLAYPIPHPSEIPGDAPYSQESWPAAAKNRAAMITRMDENIGAVLKQLSTLKADTNTIVIFTSVNGPQNEDGIDPKLFNSAGGLRSEQGSVYEGNLRVPMIIRWPARIKPGHVSDFVWGAQDLLPTAAELGYGKPPEHIDGISVFPTLIGKKQTNRHESFYWESVANEGQQAVRMNDWKLVHNTTNSTELYNLKTDPGEKQNVAEKNRDVVTKLEKALGGLPQK